MVFAKLISNRRPRDVLFFMHAKDSISSFVRYCFITLFVLAIGAGLIFLVCVLNFVWSFVFSSLEHFFLGIVVAAALMLAITVVSFLHEKFNLSNRFDWLPLVIPVLLVVATFLYLVLTEPHAPLSFLVLLLTYALLNSLYNQLWKQVSDSSEIVRRLFAAVFRALTEIILLSAAGFGFVLMSQFYVLLWGSFNPDAIWIWERLVRPLARLPRLGWHIAAVITVSLLALSLLNPQSHIVRRATGAVKFYKKALAVIAILTSFTFLSADCVEALHHDLLLRHQSPLHEARPAQTAVQIVRHVAYISQQIRVASPSTRSALASEIARLDRARDEASERALAEQLSLELNALDASDFDSSGGIGTPGAVELPQPGSISVGSTGAANLTSAAGCNAGSEDDKPSPTAAATSDFDKIYAECRRALICTLEDLLKEKGAGRLHFGSSLLDSFATTLLGSATPLALDRVVPKNLRDFDGVRQWLAQHLHPTAFSGLLAYPRPDWDRLLEAAGVRPPKISIIPEFHPMPAPMSRRVTETPPSLPERPLLVP